VPRFLPSKRLKRLITLSSARARQQAHLFLFATVAKAKQLAPPADVVTAPFAHYLRCETILVFGSLDLFVFDSASIAAASEFVAT
jgi:hypothetical protein